MSEVATCSVCHKEMLERDRIAYHSRCEDCWTETSNLPPGYNSLVTGQHYKDENGQRRQMLVHRSNTRDLG